MLQFAEFKLRKSLLCPFRILVLLFLFVLLPTVLTAQNSRQSVKSQEVSEVDGIPVLVKHLPDWDSLRSKTVFATSVDGLKMALGQRPVLDLIDFSAGTEAVTAPYPAGQLLIIEYSTPQASVDADNNFRSFLAQNNDGKTFYRRTGNYNIFVFAAVDEASASALIEHVKYEKNIQWLGEDPFLFHRLERAFVNTTSDIFLSTLEVIVFGMGLSVLGGLIVGYVFFQVRSRQKLTMNEFSDAGGMTRLNLDGLTPEISANRALTE